ncbi:hypothetical protein D3C75_987660 [compost metagenome]
MKRLLPLILMIGAIGCNASDGKSVAELEAEIAQKKIALEAAKKSGGYQNVRVPAVCIRGVLYYVFNTYGSDRVYSPAISSETLLPERCNEVRQ